MNRGKGILFVYFCLQIKHHEIPVYHNTELNDLGLFGNIYFIEHHSVTIFKILDE